MKIDLADRQTHARVNRAQLRLLSRFLMRLAQRGDRATLWGHVAVILVDNVGIRQINHRCFGRSGATDVISLRYAPIPGEGGRHSAEVFANVERACEEGARRPQWGPSSELALYVAHGCDHLTGGLDGDRRGKDRMRRRELRWLAAARDERLTEALVTTSLPRKRGGSCKPAKVRSGGPR